MSLFSRLRAVVSGDDYLDGDYDDELDYDPRGDCGTIDASPPTPEELEAVQERVAFLRANRTQIPSHAFI